MFDVIIVWKLDRFARNRYDSARYKALLRKNGVKVISANENISEGSEHSCSEIFLCPNTAFNGGIRALFLCLKKL